MYFMSRCCCGSLPRSSQNKANGPVSSAPVHYCGAWVHYSCGSTTVAFCEVVTVCLKDFFTPLLVQFSKCRLFSDNHNNNSFLCQHSVVEAGLLWWTTRTGNVCLHFSVATAHQLEIQVCCRLVPLQSSKRCQVGFLALLILA